GWRLKPLLYRQNPPAWVKESCVTLVRDGGLCSLRCEFIRQFKDLELLIWTFVEITLIAQVGLVLLQRLNQLPWHQPMRTTGDY
ncbi:MAG: hypothetical protein AAGF24_02405, partial [Cyanobacteria bacterium P01_H01_bin.121]